MKTKALRLIIVTWLIPTIVFAQGNPVNNPPVGYTPLEPLPCIPSATSTNPDGSRNPGVDCSEYGGPGQLATRINFQNYVQQTFNLVIALAAAAAVFMTVWGGLQYMTTDSWNGKKEGLDKARKALLGLLLVLTSYLLLRTIDPRLVAIRSTLVKPLDIPYTSSPPGGVLGSILNNSGLVAEYLKDNAEQVNTAQRDITGKEQEFGNLNSMICNRLNLPPGQICTEEQLNDLCRQVSVAPGLGLTGSGATDDSILQNACVGRERARREIMAEKADLEIETAKQVMLNRASSCLTSSTLASMSSSAIKAQADQCKEEIGRLAEQTTGNINRLGSLSQEPRDYSAYSTTIIDMNAAFLRYKDSDAVGKIIGKELIERAVESAQIRDAELKAKLEEYSGKLLTEYDK